MAPGDRAHRESHGQYRQADGKGDRHQPSRWGRKQRGAANSANERKSANEFGG
jgi:hypothetical protein